MANKRRALRELLAREQTVMAPSAHDALSARLIERAGFQVATASGMAMAASALATPDIGLMSGSEVIDQATRINDAVGIPIISDADTGYGNVNNVFWTVKSFERAGLAGIHLEDQEHPKKCGLLEGRTLISVEEMTQKLKAAQEAREDADFLIIARTDARGVMGLDEAKRRNERYLEAGADLILIGEHYETDELAETARLFPDKLMICGGNPGMEETSLPFHVYQEWKIKLITYPHLCLYSATKAILHMLDELRRDGHLSQARIEHLCSRFDEFQAIVGLPKWSAREARFRDVEVKRAVHAVDGFQP